MKKRRSSKYLPELVVIPLFILFLIVLVKQSGVPSLVRNTLKGTPTVTSTSPATPLPPSRTIYVRLSADGLLQLESFSDAASAADRANAQLVVVTKKTSSTQNSGTIVEHISEKFCVNIEAFLDKNGQRADRFDKAAAKDVIIILKTEDLARYAQAIADKEQMYLVPDPGCQILLTGSPTPVIKTSETPTPLHTPPAAETEAPG